jgi:hypothetical protein
MESRHYTMPATLVTEGLLTYYLILMLILIYKIMMAIHHYTMP